MLNSSISSTLKNKLVTDDLEDIHDEERQKIRAELSNMSFLELQKLKEEMGSKLYNKAVFGTTKKIKKTKTDFKRENKIDHVKCQQRNKDPRFDERAGEFNEKAFKNSYSFIEEIRQKELDQLKKDYKNTHDPDEAEKMKFLITRMENQIREKKKIGREERKGINGENGTIGTIKEGKTPVYRKKSEKRILDLVDKYEKLKQSGGLTKNIMKREKEESTEGP
ncbi:ribosomal RNA processing protein 36 homolog [Ctenocephalides felis]|uniref:ribosomal RNA processing protein 36 homolog n=1 Tax=Ctenocephalides felis TaxID=7515 RepID=UPI000E6E2335|nr:ribosomal RNA processing protein 36 homolog [Ctenocephalides felis]